MQLIILDDFLSIDVATFSTGNFASAAFPVEIRPRWGWDAEVQFPELWPSRRFVTAF